MKKGKRQIVTKNPFEDQENQHENQQYPQSQYWQAETSTSANNQNGHGTNVDPTSFTSKIKQEPEEQKEERKVVAESKPSESATDKKSRIEMLKQKYLKKGNQTTNKPSASQIKESLPSPVETKKQATESFPKKEVTDVLNKKEVITDALAAKKVEEDVVPQVVPPSKTPEPEEVQQYHPSVPQPQKKMEKKRSLNTPPPPPPSKRSSRQQNPEPQAPSPPPKEQPCQIKQKEPAIFPQRVPLPKPPAKRANAVQEIISKRLKKQVPPPPKRQVYPETFEAEQQNKEEEEKIQPPVVAQPMPLDEQYLDKKVEESSKVYNQTPTTDKSSPSFSLSEGVQLWCSNLGNTFSSIFSSDNPLLQSLENPLHLKQIKINSKNASFNDMISKMLTQFVFNSKTELTEGQKNVLNQLALEYFFGSGAELSTQFLLILVKMGSSQLRKYSSFFKQNSKNYCEIIISHQNYFLPQELGQFVDFLLQINELRQDNIHLLILLQPTDSLTNFFSSYPMTDYKNLITCLCCCQHILKTNKNILGLYLRLISTLAQGMAQENRLLELVLKYINQIESHEKYYQLQKQLKLKVINLISNSQNKVTEKVENKESKGQGKSLFSYWNKAVDTFKNTANQFVKQQKTKGTSEKPTPEQDPPEDDIKWDPVLKRYLINGKIPDDEEERAPTKAPPPPPPSKPKGSVAPPPPPGRKGRTVTATNRYA